MGEPLISVVIPAYNSARFIGEALSSVLAQTFTDYEIIVVDDGSTDDTREVVGALGDRVRLVSQKNAGAGAARNRGIAAARGTWIAFLDSDDQWRPEHLRILLDAAEASPEFPLIYGSKTTVDEQGATVHHPDAPRFPTGWIFAELIEDCLITTSTNLVRTATLRAVGGYNEDRRLRVAEDWDLYLRLAATNPIGATRDTYVISRRRLDSLSHQVLITQLGNLVALATADRLLREKRVAPENHPERIDMRDRWRRGYLEAVEHLFTVGEYAAARRCGVQALGKGFWLPPILSRTLISCLPLPVVGKLRDWARRSRRAPAGAP